MGGGTGRAGGAIAEVKNVLHKHPQETNTLLSNNWLELEEE